jgi:hypothetical protein
MGRNAPNCPEQMEGKECLLIIFEKFWVKWDWKEANLPE